MSVEDTAIQHRFEEVGRTLVSGDANRIRALFTREGRLLPPEGGFVTGRESIVRFWQGVREMGAETIDVETVATEDHGTVIIRVGFATLADGDGAILDEVKFVETWKLEDGAWRIDHDIWNSNLSGRR